MEARAISEGSAHIRRMAGWADKSIRRLNECIIERKQTLRGDFSLTKNVRLVDLGECAAYYGIPKA